nr:hypothetical protein [Prosthecomicrobium hirschii]
MLQQGRIPVEQAQQVAHRLADQDVAGLVFLEGGRAAAEALGGFALGQMEPLADAADFGRLL